MISQSEKPDMNTQRQFEHGSKHFALIYDNEWFRSTERVLDIDLVMHCVAG
jgi:hypothetical protein